MKWCLLFCMIFIINAPGEPNGRYIGLSGCGVVSHLEYECCANVNIANNPQTDYCINIKAVPNELTLNLEFKANGQKFYDGKIDPSIAQICPTPVPICLAVNHVNIASSELCTKITLGPVTLIKFPCVGIKNGEIVVQNNNFSKK